MAIASFWRWLTRAKRQRSDLHFVVYTRAACPLCDHALEMLRVFQKEYGFTIETKNVDVSEDLVREFGNWVPVVAINGRVRFRGQVNAVLLRRLLQAP
jgi:glutaredoxin